MLIKVQAEKYGPCMIQEDRADLANKTILKSCSDRTGTDRGNMLFEGGLRRCLVVCSFGFWGEIRKRSDSDLFFLVVDWFILVWVGKVACCSIQILHDGMTDDKRWTTAEGWRTKDAGRSMQDGGRERDGKGMIDNG